jgi:hypothetical protein
MEQEEVDRTGMALAVPDPNGGPAQIVLGDDQSQLGLIDWPADGIPRLVKDGRIRGQPIAALGSGAGRRIVVRNVVAGFARYLLIDASLDQGSLQAVDPSPAAVPLKADAFAPYAGPWPTADPSTAPFAVAGRELTVDAAGAVTVGSAVSAMSGAIPLGLVGEGDQVALLETVEGDAFTPAGFARDRGGELTVSQSRRIAIVPAVSVSTPEHDGGKLTPETLDAARDPSVQDGSGLLIEVPAFTAAFDAPIGSVVRTNAGGPGPIKLLEPDTVPRDAGATGGPPFRAEVVWGSSDKSGKPFTATLWIATPSGHAYTAVWHVRLLASKPRVSGEGALFSLGFGGGIFGQADPGSTVTLDGRAIQTDASGHFDTSVPAGIVPRDVQVVATDPFHRRTTILVSVVAPIDYRRLPWLPIAVLGTVLAGIIVFLRAPRSASRPLAEPQPGDAVLEEIDGDRI